MATLKQKQTAANKILKVNYPTYGIKRREYWGNALVDNEGNQYYFCNYMGVKTSEKIIDEQDLKLLDFENYNLINNSLIKSYCLDVDLSKYKKVKCDLKSLKAEKKWYKENKKKYSPNIFLYDFHFCDNSTIVDIDYLITLLTIIDEGDIYIPPQIIKPIVIKNDNSIGILMQCKPSDETAEIFAKRDKEFKYVD